MAKQVHRRRSSSSGADKLDQWRGWRAERERLQVAKLRGELLEREAVAAMVTSWVSAFRSALLAMDGRMAHVLTDEQRQQMRAEHRAILEAFSKAGQKLEADG